VSLGKGRTGWVQQQSGEGDRRCERRGGDRRAGRRDQGSASASGSTSKGSVIVFQVSSGGPIYAMDPDGKQPPLPDHRHGSGRVARGKSVAFTAGRADGRALGSLWVINVTGSGERQVMGFANQAKSPPGRLRKADRSQPAGRRRVDATWIVWSTASRPRSRTNRRYACRPLTADPYWGYVWWTCTGAYEELPRDNIRLRDLGPGQ